MKARICTLAAMMTVAMFLGSASTAMAGTYTFQPTPADLWDLDHNYYFKWGINWQVPEGEVISGANLFFDRIRNWDSRANVLYGHLLDTDFEGVRWRWDDEGGGDPFGGVKLFEWHDLPTTAQDLTHYFTTSEVDALILYSEDAFFGIGLDPDCHYYNCGITLTIDTEVSTPPAIPVPSAIGSGVALLGGLGLLRRRHAA